MSYKGRIITFSIVLIINSIYMAFYYIRDGYLGSIERIGFPIMLILAWWFGKQYDLSQYFSKEYLKKQKELESSNKALQQSKNELYSLFENSNSFIWSADLIQQKVNVSKGIERMFGFSGEEFQVSFELWKSLAFQEDREIVDECCSELLSGKPSQCQWRVVTYNGDLKWIETHGNPILDSTGATVKITGVAYDITERKKSEEQIKHMAYHDPLTGLPNRYLLNDYLQRFISLSKRNKSGLAVMFLDLDDFKVVNDTMGHDIGDILLKQVAKRLVNTVREGDIAARLGGDEFIILLNDVDDTQIEEIAERMIRTFTQPFLLNKSEFVVSTSMGISLYPQDGQDGDSLISHADAAMYTAKSRGKHTYCFYSNDVKETLITN